MMSPASAPSFNTGAPSPSIAISVSRSVVRTWAGEEGKSKDAQDHKKQEQKEEKEQKKEKNEGKEENKEAHDHEGHDH